MAAIDRQRQEIEIERGYNLMRVFNLINTDRQSAVFVYDGVRFWRENDQFVIEFRERITEAGDVLDYEEFRRAVLGSKRSHASEK